MSKQVKIKCSMRFDVNIYRILHMDGIEFYLDDADETDPNLVIDAELIKAYVEELLKKDKIDISNATVHNDDQEDPEVLEVVSFEIESNLPPKSEPDPNQIDLLDPS